MEDYYTIQNLKKAISELDFLILQRAIYPTLKDDSNELNLMQNLATCNYFERLTNEGIDVNDFDIDDWLDECLNEKIDEFVHLVNPKNSFKSFDEYSAEDVANTYKKILRSMYYERNTKNKEKILYDYQVKMCDILNFFEEKKVISFLNHELNRCGLDNFDDLSYDQISTLLVAIMNKDDFNVHDAILIRDMYRLLQIYDAKDLNYRLDNLELKYLNNEKLGRLNKILRLASMDEASFELLYESEIDIEYVDLYESDILRAVNDDDTILKAYNLTTTEISKRRNSHFNREALYYANATSKNVNSGKKRKLKMWYSYLFLYIFLFLVHYVTRKDDIMNISIRNHVLDNFKDASLEDIRQSIDDSVSDKDEITLPGLGVFFEVLWDSIEDSKKEKIVNTLYNKLKKND